MSCLWVALHSHSPEPPLGTRGSGRPLGEPNGALGQGPAGVCSGRSQTIRVQRSMGTPLQADSWALPTELFIWQV